jgi:ABC-type branched-subunit amino acid transport system permease subunit
MTGWDDGPPGIVGILFVYYHGFVSPMELSLVISSEGLLMGIVRVAGTPFGPALGAGVVVFLPTSSAPIQIAGCWSWA